MAKQKGLSTKFVKIGERGEKGRSELAKIKGGSRRIAYETE